MKGEEKVLNKRGGEELRERRKWKNRKKRERVKIWEKLRTEERKEKKKAILEHERKECAHLNK
jgi:hypothetical protein